MRPSLDLYLMDLAFNVASRSTCSKRFAVGAVASINGRIIATAYNGVPSGVPHCDESGCVRLSDGKHAYLVHAEENLVASAAKYGPRLFGATVHVTHFPCSHCSALLVQAGVEKIVFAGLDTSRDDFEPSWKLLQFSGIAVYQYKWAEGVVKGLKNVLQEVQDEADKATKRTTNLVNTRPEKSDSNSSKDDIFGHGR